MRRETESLKYVLKSKLFAQLAAGKTLASMVGPGEREGYGGPRDVTSLSLNELQLLHFPLPNPYSPRRHEPLHPRSRLRQVKLRRRVRQVRSDARPLWRERHIPL